jgi:uncharacterized SAM-binding protein YcdF (DUF218 family)
MRGAGAWLLVAVAMGVLAAVVAPSRAVFEKSVGIALMPMGLCWLVFGAWCAWRSVVNPRALWWPLCAWCVCTVQGNEPLGQWCMQQLEAPYQADPYAQGPFDAVVVLGGGASSSPHDGYELGPAGDRILLGARLYLRAQTPVLVTTGTPIAGFQEPLDSTLATSLMWQDLHIPAAHIVRVENTTTTREEATQVAALVRARGWQRVGLVTSAWHMRRAQRLFAAAGVSTVPLAADHRGTPTWNGLYSVIPTGTGAYHLQKAGWEWLGGVVGR